MRWLHKLSMQIRMLFHRNEEGARLDDELQFHLEQQIAENVARGMSAEEARHAAMRSFRQSNRAARSNAGYMEMELARTALARCSLFHANSSADTRLYRDRNFRHGARHRRERRTAYGRSIRAA